MSILASIRFMCRVILGWGWNLSGYFPFPLSIFTLIRTCWSQFKITGQNRLAAKLPGFGKLCEAKLIRKQSIIFMKQAIENMRWQKLVFRNEQNLYLSWETFLLDRVERGELNRNVVMLRMRPIKQVYEDVIERNLNVLERVEIAKRRVMEEVAEWDANPPKLYFNEESGMTNEELQKHWMDYCEESVKWADKTIKTFTDIERESNQLFFSLIVQLGQCIWQLRSITNNGPRQLRRRG